MNPKCADQLLRLLVNLCENAGEQRWIFHIWLFSGNTRMRCGDFKLEKIYGKSERNFREVLKKDWQKSEENTRLLKCLAVWIKLLKEFWRIYRNLCKTEKLKKFEIDSNEIILNWDFWKLWGVVKI